VARVTATGTLGGCGLGYGVTVTRFSTLETFEQTYGVSRAWAVAINVIGIAIFPVFATLLSIEASHHLAYEALIKKLGVVGLPYTLSFLAACYLAATLARDAHRRREKPFVVRTYAVLSAFCFFVAMEHIAWGQEIVPYKTPFGIGRINEEGKFTVHNLPGIDELHSTFLLITGLVGLIGIWLGRRPRFAKVGVPSILAPILGAVTTVAALQVLTDVVYVSYHFDMTVFLLRYAIEFDIGLICLAYVWLNGKVMRREWAAAPRNFTR